MWALAAQVLLVLVVWLGLRLLIHRVKAIEKARRDMLRGAAGEAIVASRLSRLPDDYRVINDLATP